MRHRSRTGRLLALCAVSASLALGSPSAAFGESTLYAVGFGSDGLYTLDPETGRTNRIGSESRRFNALAVQPGTGVLYAWGNSAGATRNPDESWLYTIDRVLGIATPVSDLAPPVGTLLGLAFDGDGTLFGFGGRGMAAIDLDTGVPNYLPASTINLYGADFSADGKLTAIRGSRLFIDYDLDTNSWARQVVLSEPDGSPVRSIYVGGSLVYDSQGGLLATRVQPDSITRNVIHRIDPVTGRISNIVDVQASSWPQGLAFVENPIPEPEEALLFAAGACLVLLALRKCQPVYFSGPGDGDTSRSK